MQETQDSTPHLIYLVHLWQVETATGPVWRGTVESPQAAERRCFADVRALAAFLCEQTGIAPDVFDGTSPGAFAFGERRYRLEEAG